MQKKILLGIALVAIFAVTAVGAWFFLGGGAQPSMSLPELVFPWYPGAPGNKPTGANAQIAASLSEACTIFNRAVRETAARANFCRTDKDCAVHVHDVCALGCEYFYNTQVDISSVLTAAAVFEQQRCTDCPKVCLQRTAESTECRNNVCVVKG